jgi:hypothetical protein
MTEKVFPSIELVQVEAGEVGELVHIDTPSGCFNATWLGTVSNGKELAEAMQLMIAIADEREGAEKCRLSRWEFHSSGAATAVI